jgi:8-amino-7-oxononanoate synthase
LAGDSITPIVPLIVGESKRALEFSNKLAERGILAVAIRPPTVPEGTARLRFSLMANHEERDLRDTLATIRQLADEMGVIPHGS